MFVVRQIVVFSRAMSQIKKFQVPYKSPGSHVTDWVQQRCRGQKTPQNQIVVKTPKAPKKIKPKKNEKPGKKLYCSSVDYCE